MNWLIEIVNDNVSVFRTMNGSLRYCDKCLVIKPDRAHHCSVCGTCVLKMDHHCPWVCILWLLLAIFACYLNCIFAFTTCFLLLQLRQVNNCVNFTNYKFFVLFLGYGLLYCIYVAATVLKYFILFWEVSNLNKNISFNSWWNVLICVIRVSMSRDIGSIGRWRWPIPYSFSIFCGCNVRLKFS